MKAEGLNLCMIWSTCRLWTKWRKLWGVFLQRATASSEKKSLEVTKEGRTRDAVVPREGFEVSPPQSFASVLHVA